MFHPTQTVMETVVFHAQMRLGRTLPYQHKVTQAQRVIYKAGLQGKVR